MRLSPPESLTLLAPVHQWKRMRILWANTLPHLAHVLLLASTCRGLVSDRRGCPGRGGVATGTTAPLGGSVSIV